LALWQAKHVQAQLAALGCEAEIKIIKTQGDQIQHLSFDKMEGKGFFTKEIESELLDQSIDLAVHSHKDLETTAPDGLVVAAVSERENPSDIMLIRRLSVDATAPYQLKKNAIVGTSSARRRTQLQRLFPTIEIQDLRGNVPTRIQRLREGSYDAIILAHAGVIRLGIDLSEFKVIEFDPLVFVPCPAQGVLALQVRASSEDLIELLQRIDNKEVRKKIDVERKILNLLDGGCQLPLGVYCPDDKQVFVSFSPSMEKAAQLFTYDFPINIKEVEQIVNELKSL
jgi:hydroxymethylbilane synthase